MSRELRFFAWLAAVGFWIAATASANNGAIVAAAMLVVAATAHGLLSLFGEGL